MTTPRLAEIQERVDAATEGPWRTWRSDPGGSRGAAVETAWAHDADGADTELVTDWCSDPDAEFIAHARTDVPYLLSEVRGLRAVLGEAERAYRRAREAEAEAVRWKAAYKMAEPVLAERDRLAAEIERLRKEQQTGYIEALNIAPMLYQRRAEKAEAERDALRARLDAVKALADDPSRHWIVERRGPGYTVTEYGNAFVSVGNLRAALETTPTEGEQG